MKISVQTIRITGNNTENPSPVFMPADSFAPFAVAKLQIIPAMNGPDAQPRSPASAIRLYIPVPTLKYYKKQRRKIVYSRLAYITYITGVYRGAICYVFSH